LELEAELRDEFMAEAEAAHQPASHVPGNCSASLCDDSAKPETTTTF
jgi:quinol monooxygenase YgiN